MPPAISLGVCPWRLECRRVGGLERDFLLPRRLNTGDLGQSVTLRRFMGESGANCWDRGSENHCRSCLARDVDHPARVAAAVRVATQVARTAEARYMSAGEGRGEEGSVREGGERVCVSNHRCGECEAMDTRRRRRLFPAWAVPETSAHTAGS